MSSKSTKHVIELWGLPGAGKTTLTQKLVDEYGYHFIAARQMPWQKVRLVLRYPVTVLLWSTLIIRGFVRIKHVSLFRYNVALLFSALQRQFDAEKSRESLIVIDEGVLQRFMSYSDIVYSKRLVRFLTAFSPLGDAVVLVNHRSVTNDRYTGQHLRNHLGDAYMKTWRENMSQNLKVIKQVLERSKSITAYNTEINQIEDIILK